MDDTSFWLMPTGQGWTVYLQPGHNASDFENEDLRQIALNCLTWRPTGER